MNPATASQLVLIQSLRGQLGMRMLGSHDIRCLNINCASVMIDDLRRILDTLNSMHNKMMDMEAELQAKQNIATRNENKNRNQRRAEQHKNKNTGAPA